MQSTWTVRSGGILDVNPVARLLRLASHPVDIDGDGIADGPSDPEMADSAARMLLLHVVLEHGMLWVAEQHGRLVGAAVWLPGDAASVGADLGELMRRELHVEDIGGAIGPGEHVRDHLEETMIGVQASLDERHAEQVLHAVVIADGTPPESYIALARELVAPGLALVPHALAVALDSDRARLLQAAGFSEVDRVPLGDSHQVWVGQRLVAAPIPA